MEEVFEAAGVTITKDNKKDIDRAIHKIVDTEYKNCPDAWKKVKEIIKGQDQAKKEEFIRAIRTEVGQ